MTSGPSKAVVIGAVSAMLFAIVVHLTVANLPDGESAIAWMLALPWFAIWSPAVLLARAVGFNANVGEPDLPIFVLMLLVNGLLGALIGWIIRRVYRVFKSPTCKVVDQ
jgi:hypothetical protein